MAEMIIGEIIATGISTEDTKTIITPTKMISTVRDDQIIITTIRDIKPPEITDPMTVIPEETKENAGTDRDMEVPTTIIRTEM
jgi:hypothetical protein